MIGSIQYLRALAALAVVLFHSQQTAAQRFGVDDVMGPWARYGFFGVHVFFVISGFVIAYMVIGRGQGRRSFVVNRIARIVPPYWLVTAVLVSAFLAVPQAFHQLRPDAADVVLSFLFLSWLRDAAPVVFVGWTLSYEVAFYLGVMLWYPAFRQIGLRGLVAAVLVVALGQAAFDDGGEFAPNLLFFIQFLAGVGVHQVWSGRMSWSRFAALMALGLAADAAWGDHGLLIGTVLGVVALGGGLLAESSWPEVFGQRTLMALGDASYAIYLLQVFTVPLAARLFDRLPLAEPALPFMWVTLAATALAGLVFMRWVERPMVRACQRWLQRHWPP